MLETQLSPVLRLLDRLEAILLGGMPVPFGRLIVRQHEVIKLISSIRGEFTFVQGALGKLQSPIEGAEKQGGQYSDDQHVKTRLDVDLARDPVLYRSGGADPTGKRGSQLIARRAKAIRVSLSQYELSLLDRISADTGLGFASVLRYLLLTHAHGSDHATPASSRGEMPEPVSRVNVSDMGAKPVKPSIELIELSDFDGATMAAASIRKGATVILNLLAVEPEVAQRAVDFVAGATFNIDGRQERIGDSIFLFSSSQYEVKGYGDSASNDIQGLIEGELPRDLSATEGEVNHDRSGRDSLAGFQKGVYDLICRRWNSDQPQITFPDLVKMLSATDDPNRAVIVARRALFDLARFGYIEKVIGEGGGVTYRPVDQSCQDES